MVVCASPEWKLNEIQHIHVWNFQKINSNQNFNDVAEFIVPGKPNKEPWTFNIRIWMGKEYSGNALPDIVINSSGDADNSFMLK